MTPRPFVILATQRTGSSWVAQMLDSHPAVDVFGELFDPRGKSPRYFAQFAPRRRGAVLRRHFAFLDWFYAETPAAAALGFKLMYHDVKRHPATLPYLRSRRVGVVHLVRRNLLDVVVSNETARARARYHSAERDVDRVAVRLEPAAVRKRLATLDRQVRIVRRGLSLLRCPSVEVGYEELVGDPRRFDEVFRLLGVDAGVPLTARLQKLNTAPREELVSNYDEIAGALRGTRFAAFLE